jgi:hypothetical protein
MLDKKELERIAKLKRPAMGTIISPKEVAKKARIEAEEQNE